MRRQPLVARTRNFEVRTETPIICLFGPDGAGKTSLSKALQTEYSRRGFNVRVSWMRGTHTFASLLARLMAKFPTFAGTDNFYYQISIPRRLRRLWLFVEFVSMLPVLVIRFLVPSLLGNLVIAERYIPDFIIWVTITSDEPEYPNSLSSRFLLSLLRKTKLKFYITANGAELLNRRADVTPTFIERQLELYGGLARAIGAKEIDTTHSTIKGTADSLIGILDREFAKRSKQGVRATEDTQSVGA